MAKKKSTGLTQKPDGGYSIGSEGGVAEALAAIEHTDEMIEKAEALLRQTKTYQSLQELREKRQALSTAVDEFVLSNYKAGEGYEDDRIRLTKVQGHTRRWDVEKLKTLVTPGMFKNLVKVTADPDKINEMIRKGKLKLETVAAAYTERPNKPYVRPTIKKDGLDVEAQADQLAEKLA
jgi:predicted lipid-binding transport protein (Tim44 family)